MSRTPPPLSQKETERRWMGRYAVGAFGSDAVVLVSMHEARVEDETMPPEAREASRVWLREHYPQSSVLRER